MPSVYQLKPAFQGMLRPMVRTLARAGVTANQVTLAACTMSVALGLDLAYGTRQWWMLPVFLFIRMGLNAIDGMLAREFGQQSRLGALLNEVTDVVSDATLTLPFAYLPGWNPVWVATFAVLAALVEMIGVLAQTIGASRRYDGPFGKSDRALWMGGMGIWIAMGWPLPGWMAPLMGALCVLTIYNRGRSALREAERG